MRITLQLDDELMRAVRLEAADSGRTMTQVIEEALRDAVLRYSRPAPPFQLRLTTVKGSRPPDVDLTDRQALYAFMARRTHPPN